MTPAATTTDPIRDDRLAIVLDVLLKQQAAGQSIDYDAVAKEHPDLVAEIKQLLAVGQMIDFVKPSAGVVTLASRARCRPAISTNFPAPSANTTCSKRSAAAAWASSTRRGTKRSNGMSRSR